MITVAQAKTLIEQAKDTAPDDAAHVQMFLDAALAQNPDAETLDMTVAVETLDDAITAIHIR